MDKTKPEEKSRINDVQRALGEKSDQIEQHLTALRKEITNFAPPVRDALTRHPFLSVGGALVTGILVGILKGGARRRPTGRDDVLDIYLAPVIKAMQEGMAEGLSPEEAIRSALKGRLPAPPAEAAGDGLVRKLMRMLLPVAIDMGIRAVAPSSRGSEDEAA